MLSLSITSSSSSSSPSSHSPYSSRQYSPRGKQWKDNASFIFFTGAMFGFLASSFCSVAYLSMSSSSSSSSTQESRGAEHASSMWMMGSSTLDSISNSQQMRPQLKSSTDRSSTTTTIEEHTLSSRSNIFDKSQPKHVYSNSSNNIYNNHDGWSTIHVFAGNASHIVDASAIPNDYFYELGRDKNSSQPQQQQWFSQVRQDFIVSNLLRGKRNGYFVDLAANDAIRISNTYALERNYNWTGICIEPNPVYWSSLSYRNNCHVVGAVVGERRMQEVVFKFNTAKAPQSGIVGPNFDDNNHNANGKEEKRKSTVTLVEILQRFDAPNVIDYLSLDIEGAEYFVLNTFAFDTYRFNILTVERPSLQLERLLQQNGYRLLKELRKWGETLWIHQDMENWIDKSALDIDIPKYSEKTTTTTHHHHSPAVSPS